MSRVRFWVELVVDGSLIHLDEDDLAILTDAQREAMGEEVDGAVVIEGDPALEVADDITAVAHWLCFAGPAAVLADPYGCFLYRSTQATLRTVMIPFATLVRIFGEQTPSSPPKSTSCSRRCTTAGCVSWIYWSGPVCPARQPSTWTTCELLRTPCAPSCRPAAG